MRGHRWFARIYDRVMARAEETYMRAVRARVMGSAHGRVLEIGCGTGANFPYYGHVNRFVATEPDPYMLARAVGRSALLGLRVMTVRASVGALPFEDGSFDTVASTLVFCSVADPAMALREIRRVLKPDGQWRFYEHIRYESPWAAWFQKAIAPFWSRLAGGCRPDRDLEKTIRESGFRINSMERVIPPLVTPLVIVTRPHITGVAIR